MVTGNFTGAFFAFDFAGIVSTDMIAYADIYAGSPNGAAIMDNIIYGSTVPEPGTVFGTAAALGVLLSLSFRRKSRPLTHGE